MAELITSEFQGVTITITTTAQGQQFTGEVLGSDSTSIVTIKTTNGATVYIAGDHIVAFQ